MSSLGSIRCLPVTMAAVSSCRLQEAHYCRLHSQSNVYGLAVVSTACGQHKLLATSLRGKVISMEFQETRPISREVHFTYIPGDAEIVSIDAFNKTHLGNGLVVGITFIKTSDNKPCQFLNIYSEFEPGSECNLDNIAQGCQNLELNFIPYQLCHTELCHGGSTETVFLLSGSDQKIHLFREDRYRHTFSEESLDDLFPEFKNIPSSVTWLQCLPLEGQQRRVTAYGCQTGHVIVSVIDTYKREELQRWSVQHDSPITALQLFTLHTEVSVPSFLSQVLDNMEESSESEQFELHLVVANTMEVAVIYRNVLERGLADPMVLTESDHYDSVLCICIADIDFDGQNEILLGTYGQELLVYKYSPKKNASFVEARQATSESESETSTDSRTSDLLNSSSRSISSLADGEFRLHWQRSLADPLMALGEADMTGDGVKEIIALSLKGLHVLQHDLSMVSDLCMERMTQTAQQGRQEDVFKQLLSENLSSEQNP